MPTVVSALHTNYIFKGTSEKNYNFYFKIQFVQNIGRNFPSSLFVYLFKKKCT